MYIIVSETAKFLMFPHLTTLVSKFELSNHYINSLLLTLLYKESKTQRDLLAVVPCAGAHSSWEMSCCHGWNMRCQEGLYCLTQKHKKGAAQTDSNIFWSNKFQSRCVIWNERSCRRSPSSETIILWSKLRFSKSVPSGTADQKPFKSCLLQWGSSWPGRLSHVGRMPHAHPHGHCGCLVFSIAPWKCRKHWCCAPAQWDSILCLNHNNVTTLVLSFESLVLMT